MKEYSVEVVRTSYCSKTFKVRANNEAEAESIAISSAYDTDFSGSEYDCDYEVLVPNEIPNNYIDRHGNPYDSEDDNACWPAGGGLHKDCEFNADALYAYYVIGDRYKIADYLTSKGFNLDCKVNGCEVWVKGNTEVTYENYDKVAHLWGYMHTELI